MSPPGRAWSGLGGMGASAVRALEAGVDLLLVSYDDQQTYPVLEALLRARARGELPPADEAYGRLWGARGATSTAMATSTDL